MKRKGISALRLVLLLSAATVAVVLTDGSVHFSEIQGHLPHTLADNGPGFTLVETCMVDHTLEDVPLWIRIHPMRLYYGAKTSSTVVTGFPNSSMSYTLRGETSSMKCVVRYIDRRACSIFIVHSADSKEVADNLKQALSKRYGLLPVILKES
jgi:hypothetical protein